MTPGDFMKVFSTATDTDRSAAGTHPRYGITVLQSMFNSEAALEAARRLYREHRFGLRFFCENGQTVPIDQIAFTDEMLELAGFGDPVARTETSLPTS